MSPLNPFPWFRVYTAEIDDLHGQFTPAECWAYMLIQRAIWQRGPIPPAEVQKTARVHGNSWKTMWPRLMPLFELRADGWTQPRLEAERATAASNLDQKREAGKARHRKPVDNLTGAEHFGAASAISTRISTPISPLISDPILGPESSYFNSLASADAPQIEIEIENPKYSTDHKREVALSAKPLPQQGRELSIEQGQVDGSVPTLETPELAQAPVVPGFVVAGSAEPHRPQPDHPVYSGVTQQDQTIAATAVVYSLPAAKQRDPRGSRLPDNWRPSAKEWQFAIDRGLDPEKVLELFTSHWKAVAGQKARMADWNMAWHKWVLRERPQQQRQAGLPLMRSIKTDAPLDPNDPWDIQAWCAAHPDIKPIEGTDATPRVLAWGKWSYGPYCHGKIFDYVAREVASAAGFSRSQRIDWSLLMQWIDRCLTADEIVSTVKRVAEWMRSQKNPPHSLRAFHKSMPRGQSAPTPPAPMSKPAEARSEPPPTTPTDSSAGPGVFDEWFRDLVREGIATDEGLHFVVTAPTGKRFAADMFAWRLVEAAKLPSAVGLDLSPITGWLKAGISLPDIVATIRNCASKIDYEPPTSLRDFDAIVMRERRAA
jgi:uncharacterized protein YdaU (DUF1376 family)